MLTCTVNLCVFLPTGTWSRRCAARRATYRRRWWPCSSGSVTSTRRWIRWSTRTSIGISGRHSKTRCSVRSATCVGARHPTWRHSTPDGRRSGTTTARAACTRRHTWTTATGVGPASSAAAYDPPSGRRCRYHRPDPTNPVTRGPTSPRPTWVPSPPVTCTPITWETHTLLVSEQHHALTRPSDRNLQEIMRRVFFFVFWIICSIVFFFGVVTTMWDCGSHRICHNTCK